MKRIALIDLSAIFRACWHASENEEIGTAFTKTTSAILSYAGGYDHVAICADRPPYKRREMYAEYKAQRDKAPAAMMEQLRAVEQRLVDDGYHVVGSPGYEADDIIAKLARHHAKAGAEVTIYSADKDLLQLVGDHVVVISTATSDKYDTQKVKEKFGVSPNLIPDLLALVGDKSDNIPGVDGVGIKTAAKWVNDLGGLDGVLMDTDKLPERFRSVVDGGRDLLQLSWRLTTLMTDAPINPEEILMPKTQTTNAPQDEKEDRPMPKEAELIAMPAPASLATTTESESAWDRALEPRNPQQAWHLAQALYKSRLFGDFPNPEAIMAVVLTGRSHGIDAVSSLRGFHVIKGRVSPSAQLLIGLVKRHPDCEWMRLVEYDEKHATWETKRKGEPEPTRLTYTIQHAQIAGLLGNDNWKKRPETMLRWRAGVELSRLVYPDVVTGLYTPEEISEMAA